MATLICRWSEGELLTGTLVVVFSLLFIFYRRRAAASPAGYGFVTSSFPKGPRPWPIIGNLPLLAGGVSPHHTLAQLSRNHGYPIIGLRLGSLPAIVISTASLAKELFLSHDKAFANRPDFAFCDTATYGYSSAIIFSSYNPRWVMRRKIATLELFTAKRLQDLQFVRQEEVESLLRHILQASGDGANAINVGKSVADMTSSITTRLVYSQSAANGPGLPELIKDLERVGTPTVGDFIPWLKFLDKPLLRRMKNVHERIDAFIESILEQRREAMKAMSAHELPHDFLQILLSKESCENIDDCLSSQEIKGMILDMLAAGVHTTSSTIEWAMAELLRNPRCLHKLQEEIDGLMQHEGRDLGQLLADEDVPKLPYLNNVLKEVLRLHPAVPLLVPRMSSEECKLGGYRLPKGTLAFVNVYGIGRDEKQWEKAERFWPERYETNVSMEEIKGGRCGCSTGGAGAKAMEAAEVIKKDVDVRGQHYELLPFGSGRRMCPGMRLSLSVMHVTLANLAMAFDWELPEGPAGAAAMDMSEQGGFTSPTKATPVLAIPRPRAQYDYTSRLSNVMPGPYYNK